MEPKRRSPLIYGLLFAVWALIVVWQMSEHVRVAEGARAALIYRAKDISTTLGIVLRSQRRFGGVISKERLESSFWKEQERHNRSGPQQDRETRRQSPPGSKTARGTNKGGVDCSGTRDRAKPGSVANRDSDCRSKHPHYLAYSQKHKLKSEESL